MLHVSTMSGGNNVNFFCIEKFVMKGTFFSQNVIWFYIVCSICKMYAGKDGTFPVRSLLAVQCLPSTFLCSFSLTCIQFVSCGKDDIYRLVGRVGGLCHLLHKLKCVQLVHWHVLARVLSFVFSYAASFFSLWGQITSAESIPTLHSPCLPTAREMYTTVEYVSIMYEWERKWKEIFRKQDCFSLEI